MKKTLRPSATLLFSIIMLLFSPNIAQAFFQHTIELSSKDRASLVKIEESFNKTTESFKILASHIEPEKIAKASTQAGVVLISTATAVLSAYAVFLLIQYELSKQPDTQEPSKAINWKTILAGTIGTTVFAGSILALMKSSVIAEYAITV